MYWITMLVAPFVLGVFFGRYARLKSDWGRAGSAILSALLSFLGFLALLNGLDLQAFQAGEVLGFAPVFVLIAMIPARLGVHLGSLGRPAA